MITAVLLKWKREKELEEVVRSLEKIPQIDEILIRDNRKDNQICYGRYIEALKAKNNTIYVQDDDCIVDNIPELISLYDGTAIVNNIRNSHKNLMARRKDILLGWGSLFDKSWIEPAFSKYLKLFPKDRLFKINADVIFTALSGKPFSTVYKDVFEFKSAHESMAMYRNGEMLLSITDVYKNLEKL
jgi:hypothetical protein